MPAGLNARIGRTLPSALRGVPAGERERPAEDVDTWRARRRAVRPVARLFGAASMNVRALSVGALLLAGALALAGYLVPLRASQHRDPSGEPATPVWPTRFRDQPLTQLPPGALEERFARRFPGAIARFTDGRRVIVIRQVSQTTRQLHAAEDCFRDIGYRVARPQPTVDERGERWSCFLAARDGQRVRVCERIHDGAGSQWTDASAWFWDSQYGGGPWWAITVVTPQESGM